MPKKFYARLLALLLATLSALLFVLFAASSLPLLYTWFDSLKCFIKPGLYERCGCSSAYRVLALPTRATPIKNKVGIKITM